MASLTRQEYANPFIVFQNAFTEKTPDEYEFFLFEIVHLSLPPHEQEFDFDLIILYLHLIKMLDAGQLIRKRSIEKVKKN